MKLARVAFDISLPFHTHIFFCIHVGSTIESPSIRRYIGLPPFGRSTCMKSWVRSTIMCFHPFSVAIDWSICTPDMCVTGLNTSVKSPHDCDMWCILLCELLLADRSSSSWLDILGQKETRSTFSSSFFSVSLASLYTSWFIWRQTWNQISFRWWSPARYLPCFLHGITRTSLMYPSMMIHDSVIKQTYVTGFLWFLSQVLDPLIPLRIFF